GACSVPKQRHTRIEIADKRLFGYVLAMLEGVSVERDVAKDSPPLEPGEHVPPYARKPAVVDIVGSCNRGLDPRRAPIGVKLVAQSQRHAGAGIGEDVAESAFDFRQELNKVPVCPNAPSPLLSQNDPGLVLDLVVPAVRRLSS